MFCVSDLTTNIPPYFLVFAATPSSSRGHLVPKRRFWLPSPHPFSNQARGDMLTLRSVTSEQQPDTIDLFPTYLAGQNLSENDFFNTFTNRSKMLLHRPASRTPERLIGVCVCVCVCV